MTTQNKASDLGKKEPVSDSHPQGQNARHTPGPWTTIEIRGRFGSSLAIWADEGIVCELNKDNDVYAANARLIAAAPELLEMLKTMRDVAAACFQVIDRQGSAAIDDLERKLAARNIAEGFGRRADFLIKKVQGEPSSALNPLETDGA